MGASGPLAAGAGEPRPVFRPFRPVSARPAPSSLVPSRPGPFFARPGSLLPALDRAVSSHLCQPPVRLCPSCPAPLSLSVRDGVFLPALDRAAPAHLCQPPVRLRPSPPAPACPAPFPPATECFCQPLTGLLRPTFVNLLSVSARPVSARPGSARPVPSCSCQPLTLATPAHLCQPPVRLCSSRPGSSRPLSARLCLLLSAPVFSDRRRAVASSRGGLLRGAPKSRQRR